MRRFPIKTFGNDDYNRAHICEDFAFKKAAQNIHFYEDFGDSFNFLEMRYTKRGWQARVSEIPKKLKIAQKPTQEKKSSLFREPFFSWNKIKLHHSH